MFLVHAALLFPLPVRTFFIGDVTTFYLLYQSVVVPHSSGTAKAPKTTHPHAHTHTHNAWVATRASPGSSFCLSANVAASYSFCFCSSSSCP